MAANFFKIICFCIFIDWNMSSLHAQNFNPVAENVKYIQSLLQAPGHDFSSEKLYCAFVPKNTLFDCRPVIRFQYNPSNGRATISETVAPGVYKLSDAQLLDSKYFLYEKKGIRYGEPRIMLRISQLQRTCIFALRDLDTARSRVDDEGALVLEFLRGGASCREELKADPYIEPGDSLRQEEWEFMEYHAPDRFTRLQDEDLYSCKKLLNYMETYTTLRLRLTPENARGERKKILRSLKTLFKYASKTEAGSGDGN